LAWFTLKGAENRAFNWIENPRVGGSNPPSGTIFPVFYMYPVRGYYGRSLVFARRSSAMGKKSRSSRLIQS
jgi:hypothetical protein